MRLISIFLLTLITSSAFANLPYFPLKFPRDEGSHHENIPYNFEYLMERWSLNGMLISVDGDVLDYHFSMFNTLMNDNGKMYSLPIGIMQVTDVYKKTTYSAFNAYSMNKVYFDSTDLHIQPDSSNYFDKENSLYTGYHLRMDGSDSNTNLTFGLHFENDAIKLANKTGLIQMPGNANAYNYFMPHLITSGQIKVNSKTYWIPITDGGDSWLEHTWGDYSLQDYGWELLTIRLVNGMSAHLFMNVALNTKKVSDGFIDVVMPNGDVRTIPSSSFTIKRKDNIKNSLGHSYPRIFDIDIPDLKLHIISTAASPMDEKYGFWNGYCTVTASYNNQPVNGYGHAELIYYALN